MSCNLKVLGYDAKKKEMRVNLRCPEGHETLTLFVNGKKSASYHCKPDMNIKVPNVVDEDSVITVELSGEEDFKAKKKVYELPTSHPTVTCSKGPPKEEKQPINITVNPSQTVTQSPVSGGGGVVCCPPQQQSGPCYCPPYKFYPEYQSPQLITAQTLNGLINGTIPLSGPRLVVIDLQNYIRLINNQPNPDPAAAYRDAHIPDAIFMDWRRDFGNANEPRYYNVPTIDQMEATLSAVGILKTDQLVFYDSGVSDIDDLGRGNGVSRLAVRGLFVMEYFNHRGTVHVLDGGLYAWQAAGFLIASGPDFPDPVPRAPSAPSNYSIAEARTDRRISLEYVDKNLTNPCNILVDVRPFRMWTGEIDGRFVQNGLPLARRGHMQGSINTEWPGFLSPGENADGEVFQDVYFRPTTELYQFFVDRGVILPDCPKELMLTCNEGIHAAFAWFVLTKLLVYRRAGVYEGSTGEWADNILLPMVSGFPQLFA